MVAKIVARGSEERDKSSRAAKACVHEPFKLPTIFLTCY